MKRFIIFLLTLFVTSLTFSQDTFSIVAVDLETGEVGSAGASCVDLNSFPLPTGFLGELFPGVGAINSQAYYLAANQDNAALKMNEGLTPQEIIDWLIENDVSGQPELRQYGIVKIMDGEVLAAAHTGTSTDDYKGHIVGPNYCIQGNILLGQEVLDSMESNFLNTEGDLACKLMAALQGANMVGADTRCTSNGTSSLFAFIKVMQMDDPKGEPSFSLGVETSNGDGVEPIDELQSLFDNQKVCYFSTNEISNFDEYFSVFPNPSDGMITIENLTNNSFDLKLIDAKGKIVRNVDFQKKEKLEIMDLTPGMYVVKASNYEIAASKKVIVN